MTQILTPDPLTDPASHWGAKGLGLPVGRCIEWAGSCVADRPLLGAWCPWDSDTLLGADADDSPPEDKGLVPNYSREPATFT